MSGQAKYVDLVCDTFFLIRIILKQFQKLLIEMEYVISKIFRFH